MPSQRDGNTPLAVNLLDDLSVKVVGIGGVGIIVARFASLFLASLATDKNIRLVLIDGDTFEPANAERMFFKICGNKAAVLKNELVDNLVDSRLTIVTVEEFLQPDNITRLFQEGDIVILSVDNHRTRKLASDHVSRTLRNGCLISAGNDPAGPDGSGQMRRGTYGNCQTYIRKDGRDITPSLTQWHPEIAQPSDQLPTDQSCTEMITSVPQILFANLTAASCALNAMYRYLCGGPDLGEIAFDIVDGVMRPVSYNLRTPGRTDNWEKKSRADNPRGSH